MPREEIESLKDRLDAIEKQLEDQKVLNESDDFDESADSTDEGVNFLGK